MIDILSTNELSIKGFLIKMEVAIGSVISLEEQTLFVNRLRVGKQPKEIKKGFQGGAKNRFF